MIIAEQTIEKGAEMTKARTRRKYLLKWNKKCLKDKESRNVDGEGKQENEHNKRNKYHKDHDRILKMFEFFILSTSGDKGRMEIYGSF